MIFFKARHLSVIALSGALTGCFQLEENIEIRPDASASLVVELGINSTLYAFSKFGEDVDGENALCEPGERGPSDYPAASNIESSKIELKARDDDVFCIMSYEIRDIRKFDSRTLDNDNGFQGSPGIGDDSTLTVVDEGGGVIIVRQSFSSGLTDQQKANIAAETEFDDLGDALLSSMFAGKNIIITVNAPQILESNGDISDDQSQVTWQLPVMELVDDDSKFDKEFYARVKYELTWWDQLRNSLPL